ncbi:Sel-1 1 protein [Globisporangium polare]
MLSHGERADGDDEALEQAEEHLRSALESFLTQVQGQSDDPSAPAREIGANIVETLEQLIQDVVPTASKLHILESLSDDLPQLAEQILSSIEASEAAAEDGATADAETVTTPELTRDFLDLEKRVGHEGFTAELVSQLRALANDQNDVYAKETLAYMELFEPHAAESSSGTTGGNFTQAFSDLRSAADAGAVSAMNTLAMLNLIDFVVPRSASISSKERHTAAESLLVKLAASGDLASSLAIGYRYLSGLMTSPTVSPHSCDAAVTHYHRCAESNIHTLADQGGEKPHMIVERLSEEWLQSSSLISEDGLADPAQRLEYYRTIAADPADPQWAEATEQIGHAYFYGDEAAGVQQDQQLAAQYFERAADAGDAHAQANFGLMLANGVGVPQNNASAFSYFEAAAKQGNAFAYYGLGAMYLVGSAPVEKNESLAVLYFEKAAELGYNEAHTYLGSAYLHGRGVVRNGSKAFEHFALAAETKSSQALFNLAVVQYRGVGTPKSCEQAVHNFRMVALHPDVLAELPFSLAKGYECYQKRDYLRAFLHYRLVAEFGDEDAQINAAYLLENFGAAIFPPQQQTGELSSSSGEQVIPWMGKTKTPLAEAYGLYTQAANLNDTEGIRKTAMCFYDEWGGVCQKNHSIALERYSLAAQLGDSEAAFNCGLMYAMGDGIGRNLETAKTYYAQCSQAEFPGNVPCSIALSVLETILAVKSMAQHLLAFGQS